MYLDCIVATCYYFSFLFFSLHGCLCIVHFVYFFLFIVFCMCTSGLFQIIVPGALCNILFKSRKMHVCRPSVDILVLVVCAV